MVYMSPESMSYIREGDRDANLNFDAEEPVAKWGRGRGQSEELTGGGAMEMIMVEKGDMVVQLAKVVVEQEEVQVEA